MPIGKQGQPQQLLDCTLVVLSHMQGVTNGWSCSHVRALVMEKVIVTEWFERFDVAANVTRMILMTDTTLYCNY